MKNILFLSSFVMLCSLTAFAGGSTESLYTQCNKFKQSPNDSKTLLDSIFCTGYVDGVLDGYRVVTDLHKQARFICLPKNGLSNEETIKVFSQWYKRNPNDKSLPARSGVLLSLKEAYPCK